MQSLRLCPTANATTSRHGIAVGVSSAYSSRSVCACKSVVCCFASAWMSSARCPCFVRCCSLCLSSSVQSTAISHGNYHVSLGWLSLLVSLCDEPACMLAPLLFPIVKSPCIFRCTESDSLRRFNITTTVYDIRWDLFAFAGYSTASELGGGAIVVAFRGTDSHSLYNWVENMRYWKTDYDIPYPGSEGALVHTGQFVKLHPAVSCTHCQQPPYQQSCLPKLLMCAFYGQLVVADYNTLCLTHMAWIFRTRMLASCPSQTINIARQPSLQTFYSLCKQ